MQTKIKSSGEPKKFDPFIEIRCAPEIDLCPDITTKLFSGTTKEYISFGDVIIKLVVSTL